MKGYRVAMIPKMKYVLVFDIRVDTVFVLGIFHQLENYWIKVSKHHFGALVVLKKYPKINIHVKSRMML